MMGGMPWSADHSAADFVADTETRSGRRVLAVLPAGASVQAPDRLLSHLVERTGLHRGPPPNRSTDFVVIDIRHRTRYAGKEDLLRTIEEPNVRNLLSSSRYGLIHAEPDLLVFERGRPTYAGLARRYVELQDAGNDAPAGAIHLTNCLSLLGGNLGRHAVQLRFFVHGPCANDLAIALEMGGSGRRVDLLFDGLLSPAHLRAGDIVRSSHVLDTRERVSVVNAGLRIGLLRSSGSRPMPEDPVAADVVLGR